MLKELQDIGLSEKEARVYIAALELGPTTAEKLAVQAKVNRSTTYVQLDSLLKRGLVSTYEEGKKTFFAPESPELLKHTLELGRKEFEAKEKMLGALMPDLKHLFEGAGERPLVRFFLGKEGLTTMRNQVWENNKSKEVLTLYSYDTLASVFSEQEREDYSKARAAHGVEARVLYNREAGPFPDDFSHTERRHLPESMLEVTNDISIFDDKVIISNLKGTLFGVLIENAQIAKSMASIFEFMWKGAKVMAEK
jgi:sugar-specific transcriptional regulator TrmB